MSEQAQRSERVVDVARALLRRAWREQRGQSMVFGALTAFTLVLFISLAFHVGRVSSQRMRIQNAADAAAYAGALAQANSLSAIAWLNDGMAYTYYKLMRYSVDYVVYDTLNGFKQCQPPANDLVASGLDFGIIGQIDLYNGTQGVEAGYSKAKARYEAWVTKPDGSDGRGKRWLKRLGRLARGIAAVTPFYIKQEVWRVAQDNGAQQVAVYPEPDVDASAPGRFVFKAGGGKLAVFRAQGDQEFAVQNATRRIGGGDDSLPGDWFDPRTGNLRFRGAYHQTRVCWHPDDLAHTSPTITDATYSKFSNPIGPNGHWHRTHFHSTEDFPYFIVHENGHYEPEVDIELGTHEPVTDVPGYYEFHHAVQRCTLCNARDWHQQSPNASDVRVWPLAPGPRQNNPQNRDLLNVLDDELRNAYMPLAVEPRALEVGINVGVWSAPTAASEFDSGYGDPDWGYLAFASAHVGLDEGGRIRDELSGWSGDARRNLYTSVRWGAKLVSQRTPHTNLGRGVDDLFGAMRSARWSRLALGPADPRVPAALARIQQPSSGRVFQPSGLDDVVRH